MAFGRGCGFASGRILSSRSIRRKLSHGGLQTTSTIRRKLARWAADNVRIIKELKPPQPPGFNNRLSANWKLLLQIAQHAGGGWPE